MRPIHSDSFSGPLNEARAASSAGGGTALSTTAVRIIIPNGATHVSLLTRNFSTAVVMKHALNPYLLLLKTTDNLVTPANVTDYSVVGQQSPAGAGVTLNGLDVLANGNALYIGSHLPFGGVDVTMSASVNANASVLTVKYWNGTAFAAVAGFTDNTASAGATFAQNGTVVWTVPTDWTKAQLNQTPGPTKSVLYSEKTRYWTQWTVSAKLSATVKANTMIAISRSTAYAELPNNTTEQFRVFKGPDGIAAIEALVDAGTGNVIANVYNDSPAQAF